MQLNIRDAERIFDVSEDRINRWIHDHALPYRDVGGERHFHRHELLEWATINRIAFSPDLVCPEDDVARLSEPLAAGGVSERVPGGTRREVVARVVAELPIADAIDRDGLTDLLLAREGLSWTTVGDGIAIPHARRPIVAAVERPSLRLYHLERPIDVGAYDRQPVRSLFLVVSPTLRAHLEVVAALALALRGEDFRSTVRRRAGLEETLASARRFDEALGRRANLNGGTAREQTR